MLSPPPESPRSWHRPRPGRPTRAHRIRSVWFDRSVGATYRRSVDRVDRCGVSCSLCPHVSRQRLGPRAPWRPPELCTPTSKRDPREQAHVPTEQPSPREDARLPPQDAHAGRAVDPLGTSEQGPQTARSLIAQATTASGCAPLLVLARAHRLTDSRSFSTTLRTGRRSGRPSLVVHVACDPGEHPPRLGLIVGKAVGNAVTRTTVKRRLRHIVRDRLASLPQGAMIVVRALPPAAESSSAVLARDLDTALARLLPESGDR